MVPRGRDHSVRTFLKNSRALDSRRRDRAVATKTCRLTRSADATLRTELARLTNDCFVDSRGEVGYVDGNYKAYDWVSSSARIKEILDQPAGQFIETDDLPSRDKLTHTNGFYGRCSAVFVDIRGSSQLPSKYKRPTLAKIYRAFISEMVAVLNSDEYVREVNIVGDCVWAVYNTPHKSDIDDVFRVAYTANTLRKLLSCRLQKRDIDELRLGIGVDWGAC